MPTYRFTKNGSLERPHGVSKSTFASASYGDEFVYSPLDVPLRIYHFSSSDSFQSNDYLKFKSLKNTINYYSGRDDLFNFNSLLEKPISLLSFNSVHLGAGMEKSSIALGFYNSGSLIDYATDSRMNGILYNKSDEKVGFVLYNEGFIVLNNTSSITNSFQSVFTGSNYTSSLDYPRWIYFASKEHSGSVLFTQEYNTIETLATHTTFIPVEKNTHNHSNNTTYVQSGSFLFNYSTSSFNENSQMTIKNVVKSPFTSGSADFEKETYISRIVLYDKDKKVIGYASLANPVRKTENREFLFKLKLDI